MQSSIYLTIAFMACTAAVQLNVGPQVFPETRSSSPSSQKPGKRYATQEYTLYLTPEEIKTLQGTKNYEVVEKTLSPKESQSEQQNEAEQQLKWYNSQFLPESPRLEIRGLAAHDAFLQKQTSDSDIQQGNFQYNNLYSEETFREQLKDTQSLTEKENNFGNYYNWQKKQEENTKQESDVQNGIAQWKPFYTTSDENQENILFNEQLKQQWNRILEHNRVQLKSSVPIESKKLKQNQQSTEQMQLNTKSEIGKEIENILREHREFLLSQQSGVSQVETFNQRSPILIHKEVTLTKHLPVPFVKKVKVPVPTPVIVPVPEPYEVKIPHPYPILYKF